MESIEVSIIGLRPAIRGGKIRFSYAIFWRCRKYLPNARTYFTQDVFIKKVVVVKSLMISGLQIIFVGPGIVSAHLGGAVRDVAGCLEI
jgi:hypothetical protein